jgi:hypothetical protein
MKHVKLFEAWDQEMTEQTPAQLLVTGDWTGILTNPDKFSPDFIGKFIIPATYIFEYLPAGSPIPSGYEDEAAEPINDTEYIGDMVFGGDQNGVYVVPSDLSKMYMKGSPEIADAAAGIVRLFIHPALDPMEIKEAMEAMCEAFYSNTPTGDLGESMEDHDPSSFEPEFLQAANNGEPFPRRVIFK